MSEARNPQDRVRPFIRTGSIRPARTPSPAYLASLIETAKSKSVSVIFIQEEYDIRNAETIAEEAGIALVTINPMAYDWEETMAELNLTFQKYLNE